jgi:hypothetical protein
MTNVLGCVLMAAITFPISFFVARSCLRGVIRIVTGGRTAMCYDRRREAVASGFLRAPVLLSGERDGR